MAWTSFSVIRSPENESSCSSSDWLSRIEPPARRASSRSAASSAWTPSSWTMNRNRSMMESVGTGAKSKRWQRDRTVIGIFSASVVQKMNLTCSGGSSSVFNKALKAWTVSMWTSSMM